MYCIVYVLQLLRPIVLIYNAHILIYKGFQFQRKGIQWSSNRTGIAAQELAMPFVPPSKPTLSCIYRSVYSLQILTTVWLA